MTRTQELYTILTRRYSRFVGGTNAMLMPREVVTHCAVYGGTQHATRTAPKLKPMFARRAA